VTAYTYPDHSPAARTAEAESVLHPFWASQSMDREPVMFVAQKAGSTPTATLLFPPDGIMSVTNGDGSVTFKAGIDYIWNPGSRTLIFPANSNIPFMAEAELYPPIDSNGSFGRTMDGKSGLFFNPSGRKFQNLQMNVTYGHTAPWRGYVPPSTAGQLPRTMAALTSKKPLKIVVLGDSISVGACASDFFHGPPFQPPYVGLVLEGLQVEYDDNLINLVNLSVGGKLSSWGVEQADGAAAEHPDLVLLAFGMNDASGDVPGKDYAANIRAIINAIKKSNPNAEFILVATMTANPHWSNAHQNAYTEYEKALRGMTGPGIALADVTAIWRDILEVKKFIDLTGNGVNHPNDFGYRVYAQVILSLLK
jgi:lysophospholipase L1-like esterase